MIFYLIFLDAPSISPSELLHIQNKRNIQTPTTPTTPTSSCYIGDRNATESWGPKRKKSEKQHNYFHSNLLREFDSPKVTNQIFQVKDKRVTISTKLKNHLFDDPDKYLNTNEHFIVAASSLAKDACILSNYDYKTLKRDQPVALGCIQFLLQLFSKKRKDIQFIIFETSELISEKLARIQKDNILGIIYESAQYSLLIINLKKKGEHH